MYSKWSGHVHEMKNENAISENQLQNTTELTTKEGMYVSRGQTIFNVVDPHHLIVVLQIRAEDIAKIKLNQDCIIF